MPECKKKYQILLFDPPWNHEQKNKTLGAVRHYRLMSASEILGMAEAVKSVTDECAHLYLWATNAALEDAYKVVRAWGFTPRSLITWIKPYKGMSAYYFRNQTEQLIFATKGKAYCACRTQPNIIYALRQDHSHKPEELFPVIDRMSGYLGPNRLEGFARRRAPGWDVWGNEIDSDVSFAEYGYPVPSDRLSERNVTEPGSLGRTGSQ